MNKFDQKEIGLEKPETQKRMRLELIHSVIERVVASLNEKIMGDTPVTEGDVNNALQVYLKGKIDYDDKFFRDHLFENEAAFQDAVLPYLMRAVAKAKVEAVVRKSEQRSPKEQPDLF